MATSLEIVAVPQETHKKLVHAMRTQSGSPRIGSHLAGTDATHELGNALRASVGSLYRTTTEGIFLEAYSVLNWITFFFPQGPSFSISELALPFPFINKEATSNRIHKLSLLPMLVIKCILHQDYRTMFHTYINKVCLPSYVYIENAFTIIYHTFISLDKIVAIYMTDNIVATIL